MPNRIIRDVGLTSRKLAKASDFGERLYWRLYQAVDDFGRFYGDPTLIMGRCFALMTDTVNADLILKGRAELARLGLIVLYRVGDDDLIQIIKFDQRVRANKSRFPPPNDRHMTVTCQSSARPYEDRGSRIVDEDRGTGIEARGSVVEDRGVDSPPPARTLSHSESTKGSPTTWDRILLTLQTKVNRQSYNTWLRPTQQLSIDGRDLCVEVPTPQFADWISKSYMGLIREAARGLDCADLNVTFTSRQHKEVTHG